MAVGEDEPASSTNPFGEPDEDDEEEKKQKLPTVVQSPTTIVVPFIKVPILIACTIIVFILLIGGTATTALAFPPSHENGESRPPLDGNYKLVGPLMLTAGCFLFIVYVALCSILTREAYYSSRMVQPVNRAWNEQRSLPVSLVGGPFYIATAGPPIPQTSLAPFHSSPWVYPNAPLPESPDPFWKKSQTRSTTATITRQQQPPFNPDIDMSIDGA